MAVTEDVAPEVTVSCRERVSSRHIRLSGTAIHHELLIRHRLYVAWTGGPVVDFRFLWLLVRSPSLLMSPYEVETAVQCSVCGM